MGFIARILLYPALVMGLGYLLLLDFDINVGDVDRESLGGLMVSLMLVAMVVELAVLSGRILREEVRKETLQSLMLLPASIAEVFYSKLGGYLLAIMPAALYFLVGVLLILDNTLEFMWQFVREPKVHTDGMIIGFGLLTQFFVFLHLGACLSLYIKWGAVPVAFAVTYVFIVPCMGIVANFVFGDYEMMWLTFVAGLTGCILVGVLHVQMGKQLRDLAGR